jgi:hypothetical protein
MASTFSPSLRIELIGNGDQSGTWGQTTNNNLGTLIEQGITGVQTITMVNADYTLTNFNGVSDEARNAVLIVIGSNSAIRKVVCPLVNKTYVIYNNTSGGFAITVGGATGSTVSIANGITAQVYCNGTDFFPANTGAISNFSVNNTLAVGGATALTGALSGSTAAFSGAISSVSPAFTGTPTVPTASPGTNTTQAASTAFVTSAVTTATGSLGTISTQNADNVAITGGSITGITDLAVADGGTGRSTLTANAVLVGNGTSGINSVSPGASGNLLVSNGTTWNSTTLAASGAKLGLAITGEVWNDVTGSRSFNTQYTNSRSYPIAVSARTTCSTGSAIAFIVNGVTISNFSWQFNGCGSFGGGFVIVPPGQTYQLNSGQGLDFWRELY